MEPGLRRGHCPAVPVRSPGGASSGPWPGELRAAGVAWPGWSRIRLLYFLCNSSSGLPPGSVARKSMCSDSIISQVALLQVHCTRKGDISGHVCVDQTGVCVCTHTCVRTHTNPHFLSSLPPIPAPSPPPSTGFTGISQPLQAFVKTLICVCARPLMADAKVCGAYLCSALVMARNVPLIMHLWNSAVWEPSNYPTVAFPASVSSQLGLH